jgi:Tol biopolymer transport system component
MDAFGGNQINLTNHPSGDHAPSWSPDGSNRVKISSGFRGWDPIWSPDGKYILTWHSAEEEIVMMNPDGSGEQRWSGGGIDPGPQHGAGRPGCRFGARRVELGNLAIFIHR